jgi:glycine cleavage system H protein
MAELDIENAKFPEELYYHVEHAYARLEDDGTVTVGMSDFAQEAAGEIAYMDMPMEGDEVAENETAAKIQTAKWIGKLLSPLTGEVTEINEDVEDQPALINEDPYGEGWIFKMQPSDWEGEKDKLLRAGTPEFDEWLAKEIERVKKEMEESENKD